MVVTVYQTNLLDFDLTMSGFDAPSADAVSQDINVASFNT